MPSFLGRFTIKANITLPFTDGTASSETPYEAQGHDIWLRSGQFQGKGEVPGTPVRWGCFGHREFRCAAGLFFTEDHSRAPILALALGATQASI
jgi:hypothetical protein